MTIIQSMNDIFKISHSLFETGGGKVSETRKQWVTLTSLKRQREGGKNYIYGITWHGRKKILQYLTETLFQIL